MERGIGHLVSMETVVWMQPQLMMSLNHRLPETEVSNMYSRRDCLMFPYSLYFAYAATTEDIWLDGSAIVSSRQFLCFTPSRNHLQ